MDLGALSLAAVLLAIERVVYAVTWARPDAFRRRCNHSCLLPADPVTALKRLFYAFKALQLSVFAGWILCHASGSPAGMLSAVPQAVGAGAALIALGQILNASVFWRLGSVGVFYGARFGHDLPWLQGFPFSAVAHPQYVGTVLSIWGLFLCARFPHEDWFVLPTLSTLYYAAGVFFEQEGESSETPLRGELDASARQPAPWIPPSGDGGRREPNGRSGDGSRPGAGRFRELRPRRSRLD